MKERHACAEQHVLRPVGLAAFDAEERLVIPVADAPQLDAVAQEERLDILDLPLRVARDKERFGIGANRRPQAFGGNPRDAASRPWLPASRRG